METNKEPISNKTEIKINSSDIIYATGRRKRSIARVWLKKGTGMVLVNGKKVVDYFKKPNLQTAVYRPLSLTQKENEVDLNCLVKGGGTSGQAGALSHGISRALVDFDPNLKTILKKEKLTTRDSRAVERKKYGHRKARRSFQFSKR
tara:strand:+ start:48 stop:488 length:441 start_codon:yes stop_codon:yes gene_type:complete